jgi:hypothetical protein
MINWLIYISGWFIGYAVFNTFIRIGDKDSTLVSLVIWTMSWIWICVRFIK